MSEPISQLAVIRTYLEEKKLNPETIAFLMGRIVHVLLEKITIQIAQSIGQAEVSRIFSAQSSDEERMRALGAAYQEKTGKSFSELKNTLITELLTEFSTVTQE